MKEKDKQTVETIIYYCDRLNDHITACDDIEPPRPVEGGDSQTKKYIVYYFGNFTAP